MVPVMKTHLSRWLPAQLLVLFCGMALVTACGGDFAPPVKVEQPPPVRPSSNDPAGRPGLGFKPAYDSQADGCMVDSVIEGGPAAKAGIRDGDVIIELGDSIVFDVRSYSEALQQLTIGQKVKVRVIRGNEILHLDATVGRSMR